MIVFLGSVLAGCGPGLPDVARTAHIDVLGHPIAIERLEVRGDRLLRERVYRFRLGDQVVEQTLTVTGALGPDGSLQALTQGDRSARRAEESWVVGDLPTKVKGRMWLPLWPDEAWQGPGERTIPGSDLWPLTVTVGADGAWSSRHGRGRLVFEGDRLVSDTSGPVAWVRGDADMSAEVPDLSVLLGRPTQPLPHARQARVLTVRFPSGPPEAVSQMPRARCDDGLCEIEVPLPEELPTVAFLDEGHAEYRLAPSDPDGQIAVLASRLPSVEAPRKRLGVLVALVRQTLDFQPEPGVPGALSALASGSGDCNEHAALAVAVARQGGWAARTVTGLAYSDAGDRPGFYPHAWMEVWLGPAGWVPVDPALGQTVADAARIPLVREGDAPLWTAVALVAEVPFEIVAVR